MELSTRINHQLMERNGSCSGNNSDSLKGVSFTRWGYSDCPKMTELVYSGIMVNGLNNVSMPQCFSLNSNYSSELNKLQKQETMQKTDEENSYELCAVCYSNRYSTVLMLPGSHICASGWTTAYQGLLVANDEASYLCMDGVLKPQESRARTANNYCYVTTSCDALPCPPYKEKSNLTCAVCIK